MLQAHTVSQKVCQIAWHGVCRIVKAVTSDGFPQAWESKAASFATFQEVAEAVTVSKKHAATATPVRLTFAGAETDSSVAIAQVGRSAGSRWQGRVDRVWAAVQLAGQRERLCSRLQHNRHCLYNVAHLEKRHHRVKLMYRIWLNLCASAHASGREPVAQAAHINVMQLIQA